MDRIKLFDKLFKERYENPNGFSDIRAISSIEFNCDDEFLVESIGDEMNKRGWVQLSSHSKYNLRLSTKGQQAFEKYGSYSSFLRSENKIKNKRKAEKRVKLILSIIASIGVIWGMFFTYLNYQKNDTIDNQEKEIKRLNLV